MLTYADADTVDVELRLSPSGTRKFIDLLAATNIWRMRIHTIPAGRC